MKHRNYDQVCTYYHHYKLDQLYQEAPIIGKKFEQAFIDPPKLEFEPKIRTTLFTTWVTNEDNPREISLEHLNVFLHNVEELKALNTGWTFEVWCNNPNLIPLSVAKLEQNNIKIVNAHNHQSSLILLDTVDKAIASLDMGIATDLLRYNIMASYGGVYADLDFKFEHYELMDDVTHRYNFFKDNPGKNSFFAASKEHPIFISLVDNIQDLVLGNTPSLSTSLLAESFALFAMAIPKKANLDGNIDLYGVPGGYNLRDGQNAGESENIPNFDGINENCDSHLSLYRYLNYIEVSAENNDLFFIGMDVYHGAATWDLCRS